MIGYVTIGTSDMPKALDFYDELLAEIGGKRVMGMDRIQFYANGKGAMLAVCVPYDEQQQHCGNGVMVAIDAGSAEMSEKLYNKAISLGATCEGEPGQRLPIFFGAYVRDLDGNKLCFYHMSQG